MQMEDAIDKIISVYLTVISFLLGTATFVLGIYISAKAHVTTQGTDRNYKLLILAVIIPIVIMICLGIFFVFNSSLSKAFSFIYFVVYTNRSYTISNNSSGMMSLIAFIHRCRYRCFCYKKMCSYTLYPILQLYSIKP